MFIKILTGLVIVIAVFVVVVATRSDEFRVTRTATINAAPAAVFAQVNDLHNWNTWSPWAKLDPTAKITYEGPDAGVGAFFKWEGNDKIGAGSMTLIESRPNELVRFKLEFIKPFAGTNTAEFTFEPQGSGTMITWSMFGKNDFLGKAMGLIMNCDKMIGGQFEQGFSNLRSIVEKK